MMEVGSFIGGEGNGGVMLTDIHVGRGMKTNINKHKQTNKHKRKQTQTNINKQA